MDLNKMDSDKQVSYLRSLLSSGKDSGPNCSRDRFSSSLLTRTSPSYSKNEFTDQPSPSSSLAVGRGVLIGIPLTIDRKEMLRGCSYRTVVERFLRGTRGSISRTAGNRLKRCSSSWSVICRTVQENFSTNATSFVSKFSSCSVQDGLIQIFRNTCSVSFLKSAAD